MESYMYHQKNDASILQRFDVHVQLQYFLDYMLPSFSSPSPPYVVASPKYSITGNSSPLPWIVASPEYVGPQLHWL